MRNPVLFFAVVFSMFALPLTAAKPEPAPIRIRNSDPRMEGIVAAMPQFTGQAIAPEEDLSLWFRSPAEQWVYALPIGNGRLGAMVYGGVNREYLQLNEESVWSGKPIERDNPTALDTLPKARELLFEQRYTEAQDLIAEHFMGTRIERGLHCYQTLGDLVLTFPEVDTVHKYRRDLNLDTAIARVCFTADGVTYTREVFSSLVDEAIVMRISADQPGKVSFEAELNRPADFSTTASPDGTLLMRGQVRASDQIREGRVPSAEHGVNYAARLKILPQGGDLVARGDSLSLEGADSAVLILTAATDYWGGKEQGISGKQLDLAATKSFGELKAEHIREHQRLFRRVSLDLGGTEATEAP